MTALRRLPQEAAFAAFLVAAVLSPEGIRAQQAAEAAKLVS
jgi:hypothetical protein